MKNLILLIAILSIIACSQQDKESAEVAFAMKLPPQDESKNSQPTNVDKGINLRKLIKEGYIEFETTDIIESRSQILTAVSANGGYISSDEESRYADKRSYTMIVRVPAARFDTLLSSATKGVLYFDLKKINVKDVTAEYFDIQTRLKTKKEIESRYLQLLNKASGVKDILAIEKELGTIRTEIESAEGQLKLLTDEVQYSTLRITFYKISSTPAVFSHQISSAFVKGWENLLAVCLVLIDIWPFIILAAGLWFGFKRIRSKSLTRIHTIKNQQ